MSLSRIGEHADGGGPPDFGPPIPKPLVSPSRIVVVDPTEDAVVQLPILDPIAPVGECAE